MSSVVQVSIHPSQFPEAIQRDLIGSLRSRKVNHKFHYDSVKQTAKWLALHQAYSPSRTDADCAATYDRAFSEAVRRIDASAVHLLGLGCGGGQKDARLIRLLKASGRRVEYTPSDVSVAMVLTAAQVAASELGGEKCHPLVLDLSTAEDVAQVLDRHIPSGISRLVTFFGMIPNFEPGLILPRLASLLRGGDCLLFSANLAPGDDYAAGVQRILPLYDNQLTREWLMTVLLDLGVESGDGDMRFTIEDDPAGTKLLRVIARFHFLRSREIHVHGGQFHFSAGDAVQVFFSYRHTPSLVGKLLAGAGISVIDQWITASEEEGVFLCRRD